MFVFWLSHNIVKVCKAIYNVILLGTTLFNTEMDIMHANVHQYILSM